MIARGRCHVYFAFLAASQVDLDQAQEIARSRPTERTRFQRNRRAPAYLDFDPPPLQVTMACESVSVGARRTESFAEVTIFDWTIFMESSQPPLPFDQPGLVALKRLSAHRSSAGVPLWRDLFGSFEKHERLVLVDDGAVGT